MSNGLGGAFGTNHYAQQMTQMQQYMSQVQYGMGMAQYSLTPPPVSLSPEEAKALNLNTIKPTPNKLLLLVEDLP